MLVTKLYLQDFRAFSGQTWDFDSQLTLIIAPNGKGKTTILEALQLLSLGKSFRAGKTAELVKFGREIARAYCLLDDGLRLGVTLTGGQVGGQKTQVRRFALNQTKKRAQDFVGNFLTTCFRPEDLRLIEGSSTRRRDYLDVPLELTSPSYRQARKNYQAALVRRNKTLVAIREGELGRESLSYWNEALLQAAAVVSEARAKYLEFVDAQQQTLNLFHLHYDHSLVTRERLAHYQSAEIASGHSLIGPHKDDFSLDFEFAGVRHCLMTYGSRGQHRLAVLWLKLAELAYLQQVSGQTPVLLLDDICSELDEQAKQLVVQLAGQQQTIITTTEENVLELWGKKTQVIRL